MNMLTDLAAIDAAVERQRQIVATAKIMAEEWLRTDLRYLTKRDSLRQIMKEINDMCADSMYGGRSCLEPFTPHEATIFRAIFAGHILSHLWY